MQRPPSKSRDVARAAAALAAGALAMMLARPAHAQACCAGGAAYDPGRLQLFEDAAVALGLRVTNQFGSFDTRGRYTGQPAGASEVDLEQDFVGTLRVFRYAQVGVLVPVVETRRAETGVSDMGGGIGDVRLTARYDFVNVAEFKWLPGLGVVAAVTLPTGTAVEDSMSPLAAGTTGFGAWQTSLGASVEQAFGPLFLGMTGGLSYAFSRKVGAVDEQLGMRLSVVGAGGYIFDSGPALLGTLSYSGTGESMINGQSQPGTGERQLTLGVAGGVPVNRTWRLQASLFSDLPAGGQNHPAGFGGTFLLLRAWM